MAFWAQGWEGPSLPYIVDPPPSTGVSSGSATAQTTHLAGSQTRIRLGANRGVVLLVTQCMIQSTRQLQHAGLSCGSGRAERQIDELPTAAHVSSVYTSAVQWSRGGTEWTRGRISLCEPDRSAQRTPAIIRPQPGDRGPPPAPSHRQT
jgi:hypothetical protein